MPLPLLSLPIVRRLVSWLQRNAFLRSPIPNGIFGAPKMEPDHPGRCVLFRFLPKLLHFGRFPIITRVASILWH